MLNVDAIHAAASSPLTVARRLGLEIGKTSRSQRTVRVRCPWHEDDNPSCDLTERSGRVVAYCRSCGEGGDVLSIVAAINGLDVRRHFKETAKIAAEAFGIELDGDFEPTPRDPIADLAMALDASADRFGRGLRILAHDAKIIEAATSAQLLAAFDALRALDDARIKERDETDAKLEAVGDLLEASGLLEWNPR